MRTRLSILGALVVIAMGVLAPALALAAACGPGTLPPQCDGACPPGLMCADSGGGCSCVPAPFTCADPGNPNGAPLCWGECPPSAPICATFVGGCACTVPTLSEWGIIIMSLVMFGGVWHRRWRHAAVQKS